jgi:hypothetical protein
MASNDDLSNIIPPDFFSKRQSDLADEPELIPQKSCGLCANAYAVKGFPGFPADINMRECRESSPTVAFFLLPPQRPSQGPAVMEHSGWPKVHSSFTCGRWRPIQAN